MSQVAVIEVKKDREVEIIAVPKEWVSDNYLSEIKEKTAAIEVKVVKTL